MTLRCAVLVSCVIAVAGCAQLGNHRTPPYVTSVEIRDVTVVDVVAGSLLEHRTVRTTGNLIVAITPADPKLPSTSARIVDGRGKYLIPGLWDMHSHSLWSLEAVRTFLPLYVAEGVTGIRDMGGTLPVLRAFRDSASRFDPPWPRVVAAGEILDGPKPVQAEISIGVADAAGARAAVDSLARAGADFIKVYTLLPREAYFAVLDEARHLSLPVAGHLPAAISPEEASAAGQRSIEHLRDEIEPFCSDRDTVKCTALAELFRSHRTWQVPTLVALRSKAFFDDSTITTDPRLRYLPQSVVRDWLAERSEKIRRGKAYAESKRARFADEMWTTRFFNSTGVSILAGTDAGIGFSYPGFSLHDELALLVDAGLTPLEALRSATLAPAEFLGARDSMGSVAVGKSADLVLLNRNPFDDISATREISAVILRGRLFTRNELDQLLLGVQAATGATTRQLPAGGPPTR